MDGNKGPEWLREAAVLVRDEAVRFMVTVLQCSRHPRRFAAAWFAGETRAPNPIGYVSTALAVTAAAKATEPIVTHGSSAVTIRIRVSAGGSGSRRTTLRSIRYRLRSPSMSRLRPCASIVAVITGDRRSSLGSQVP